MRIARKWASGRKHFPLADVAAAGGWRDQATLMIYQATEESTILAVMNEPGKRHEKRAAVEGG